MNTGVCITCGAQDVDLNDDTEQCEGCQASETGEAETGDKAADDEE